MSSNFYRREYPIINKEKIENEIEKTKQTLDMQLSEIQDLNDFKQFKKHVYDNYQNLFEMMEYEFYSDKKYVTFVGSRQTPSAVITQATKVLFEYLCLGYVIRSGNATGLDSIVTTYCSEKEREIYLPYEDFNYKQFGKSMNNAFLPNQEYWPNYQHAIELVYQYHLLHNAVPKEHMKYLARDVYEVLGIDLKTPSEKVICWTPDGAETTAECTRQTGGTGMAIRIADAFGIPVVNLNKQKELSKQEEKEYEMY